MFCLAISIESNEFMNSLKHLSKILLFSKEFCHLLYKSMMPILSSDSTLDQIGISSFCMGSTFLA
ncbi:hypothetical protein BpHYR1_006227 [Brachionus plicatilis]|uniref:Uncharacterized protein n=1 Tax=Brachionus plicatilis TaxID=10195 RepID=A0A3M7S842_BRAPC|nr:hypothetical protein BpHYR1_006227 [Brachionus plicatilis]